MPLFGTFGQALQKRPHLHAKVLVDLSNTSDTISSERLEVVQEGDVDGEATLSLHAGVTLNFIL